MARDHIAEAIAINPDAHFGREKYQLMAIDWLREIHAPGYSLPDKSRYSVRAFVDRNTYTENRGDPGNAGWRKRAEEAALAISGLIRLGDAWQSVDVFYALQDALQVAEHGFLAYLAQLRRNELSEAGAESLFPKLDDLPPFMSVHSLRHKAGSNDFFAAAREEAENWHEARMAYLQRAFASGRHPDTEENFWAGFTYDERPPEAPNEANVSPVLSFFVDVVIWLVIVTAVVVVLLIVIRFRRRRFLDGIQSPAG